MSTRLCVSCARKGRGHLPTLTYLSASPVRSADQIYTRTSSVAPLRIPCAIHVRIPTASSMRTSSANAFRNIQVFRVSQTLGLITYQGWGTMLSIKTPRSLLLNSSNNSSPLMSSRKAWMINAISIGEMVMTLNTAIITKIPNRWNPYRNIILCGHSKNWKRGFNGYYFPSNDDVLVFLTLKTLENSWNVSAPSLFHLEFADAQPDKSGDKNGNKFPDTL